jgi:hypothetical protein
MEKIDYFLIQLNSAKAGGNYNNMLLDVVFTESIGELGFQFLRVIEK